MAPIAAALVTVVVIPVGHALSAYYLGAVPACLVGLEPAPVRLGAHRCVRHPPHHLLFSGLLLRCGLSCSKFVTYIYRIPP